MSITRRRHVLLRRGIAALLAVAGCTLAPVAAVASPSAPREARSGEFTGDQNAMRTGWDTREPELNPRVVASPRFTEQFATRVNGEVYAQPVIVGQTMIVATENDWVYGIDKDSGAIEWSVSLGTPWPTATENCGVMSPNSGVTSTPVYDPATGTVYLVAKVNDGPTIYQPHYYMFGLSPGNGSIQWRVPIQGAPPGDPAASFDPYIALQRTALLLMDGKVYAGFASFCDELPYDGVVAGVSTSTRQLTLWSDEAGGNEQAGGIWQGGGGLMSDGSGRIFLSSGNGLGAAPGPGTSPHGFLAGSVVRLDVSPDGTMKAADFFSPANAEVLNSYDLDLGSGGPVGLPFGTREYPHLLVTAGKDGRVFLLNRDALGGRAQGPNGTDAVVSESGPYDSLLGHAGIFGGGKDADYAYLVGTGDVMRAMRFEVNSSGTPRLVDVANSTTTFGYGSGSPVVTSDGSDARSAVVWAVNANGADSTLEAFDAIPRTVNGTPEMKEIWSAPIGDSTKFTVPATDDGRVYVGTEGYVLAFGESQTASLTGTAADFGQVAVGSVGSATVTVTAISTVTISSMTTMDSSFATGTPSENGSSVTLPVTLAPGQRLEVPVTYTPGQAGGDAGALELTTNSSALPTTSIGLYGTGTSPGLYASQSSVDFPAIPVTVDLEYPAIVNMTNGGTTSETISSVTAPSAPFRAGGLPSAGSVLTPGASVAVAVSFAPTVTGSSSSSFTITTADGRSLTVALSGKAIAGSGVLAASSSAVDFGSVPVGQTATQTITLSRTGDLSLTVTGATAPSAPFSAVAPVVVGQPVGIYKVPLQIAFTPTEPGTFTSTYQFTATDGKDPPQTETVTLTGTATS